VLRAAPFRTGRFDTELIDRNLSALGAVAQPLDRAAAALGAVRLLDREQQRICSGEDEDEAPPSPWDAVDGYQLSGVREVAWPMIADGELVTATLTYHAHGRNVSVEGIAPARDARVIETDDAVYVLREGRQTVVRPVDFEAIEALRHDGSGIVVSPMHGKVLEVLVKEGEAVHRGQRLAVVEAMKMEHAVVAPVDGVVGEIVASAGAQLAEKATILVIETAQA